MSPTHQNILNPQCTSLVADQNILDLQSTSDFTQGTTNAPFCFLDSISEAEIQSILNYPRVPDSFGATSTDESMSNQTFLESWTNYIHDNPDCADRDSASTSNPPCVPDSFGATATDANMSNQTFLESWTNYIHDNPDCANMDSASTSNPPCVPDPFGATATDANMSNQTFLERWMKYIHDNPDCANMDSASTSNPSYVPDPFGATATDENMLNQIYSENCFDDNCNSVYADSVSTSNSSQASDSFGTTTTNENMSNQRSPENWLDLDEEHFQQQLDSDENGKKIRLYQEAESNMDNCILKVGFSLKCKELVKVLRVDLSAIKKYISIRITTVVKSKAGLSEYPNEFGEILRKNQFKCNNQGIISIESWSPTPFPIKRCNLCTIYWKISVEIQNPRKTNEYFKDSCETMEIRVPGHKETQPSRKKRKNSPETEQQEEQNSSDDDLHEESTIDKLNAAFSRLVLNSFEEGKVKAIRKAVEVRWNDDEASEERKMIFDEMLKTITSPDEMDRIFLCPNEDGKTPIMNAVYSGNTEAAIQMLEMLPQESCNRALMLKTHTNSSTIYIACARKNLEFLQWFQENVRKILKPGDVSKLLNYGPTDPSLPPTIFDSANVNLRKTRGGQNQKFHVARCQEIIKILNDLKAEFSNN